MVGGEKKGQKVIFVTWANCKWVAFGLIRESWRLKHSSEELSSRGVGLGRFEMLPATTNFVDFWLLFMCKTGCVPHLGVVTIVQLVQL